MNPLTKETRKICLTYGLPSSGKTTLAAQLQKDAIEQGFSSVSIETDDYFMVNGVYQWDYRRLTDAHKHTHKLCVEACQKSTNLIIIANVNLNWAHCKAFIYCALLFNYEVEFVEPNTPWKNDLIVLHEKSKETHNVRMSEYEFMKAKKQSVEFLREKARQVLHPIYEW